MENLQTQSPKIKDYTYQDFQETDEKDFRVKTLADERLIDSVPGLDETFEEDMFNFGDQDDLPDSDRILDCRAKGLDYDTCFDR